MSLVNSPISIMYPGFLEEILPDFSCMNVISLRKRRFKRRILRERPCFSIVKTKLYDKLKMNRLKYNWRSQSGYYVQLLLTIPAGEI